MQCWVCSWCQKATKGRAEGSDTALERMEGRLSDLHGYPRSTVGLVCWLDVCQDGHRDFALASHARITVIMLARNADLKKVEWLGGALAARMVSDPLRYSRVRFCIALLSFCGEPRGKTSRQDLAFVRVACSERVALPTSRRGEDDSVCVTAIHAASRRCLMPTGVSCSLSLFGKIWLARLTRRTTDERVPLL